MATSLIKTAQALGTAAEQLQSAEFVRSTVRDFDLRRATAIEAHVVRSTASVCSRRLLAPLASNVEAAPAASKAAPRKELPTVGMSPKTLKRKFNDCIGAMERDVEAFDLGDQSAVVQSMKAAFEGESTAVRNLRQRLEGQAAEAEASAAAERGQPASLVTRDAIHARVASKTQSLANAKRKSEQLKAERKALGEAKGCAEQEQDLGHEPTEEPEQATAAVTPAEDVEALEELEELDAELEQLRSKVQAEASRVEDLRCVLVSVRESKPTAELQAEANGLATKHETRSTLLHPPETHTNSTLTVKLCIVATHARCQSGVCTYLPHFYVIQFVNAPEISLRHRDVPDGSFLADHSAFTSHHRTGRNSLVKFSVSCISRLYRRLR